MQPAEQSLPLAPTQQMRPFASLEETLAELLKCMALYVPMRLWIVARVEDDAMSVMHAEDAHLEIAAEAVFPWKDTLCYQTAKHNAPRFAPHAQAVEAYRNAAENQQMEIGAYIGFPLHSEHGTLQAVLYAIDPEPQAPFSHDQQRLVETMARTISYLISGRMKIQEARRAVAQFRQQAQTDELTGLANRHAWRAALAEEETQSDGTVENAMVLVMDLDGLKEANDTLGHAEGDRYIMSAATALQNSLREADVIARIGGDEFAVLIRGITKERAAILHSRILVAFENAGVRASTGYALRQAHETWKDTVHVADIRMYESKARRKRKGLSEQA